MVARTRRGLQGPDLLENPSLVLSISYVARSFEVLYQCDRGLTTFERGNSVVARPSGLTKSSSLLTA